MRRLLIPAILAATLTAAACAKPAGDAAGTPVSRTLVSIDTADTNQYMIPLGSPATQPMRDAIMALERGDIPAMMANMSDSVVWIMPDGSEIKGKQAVSDYWTDRRANVIASMKFGPLAGLGFQLFRSRNGGTLGKYLMVWTTVDATYKNGKSVKFPGHMAVLLDEAGKFSRWMNYYDTKGIADAQAAK